MPSEADAPASGALVLGVDGGGSRCTAVLAIVEPGGCRELGRGQAGPANAVSVGFVAAAAAVEAAVEAATRAAGAAGRRPAAACLGLAGAGSPDVADRWVAWAREGELAGRVEVMPDGLPALAGEPGLLVISGTGSIVWGRRSDGGIERCGGRGGLVGDEGSGYALAVAGLRAAVRSADGWGDPTRLLDLAIARFAAADVAALVASLARPGLTRGHIASFATDVAAAAAAGDEVAGRLLAAAGADLGRQAIAVARAIGLEPAAYALRLAGGVLCHVEAVRRQLTATLTAGGLPPATTVIVPDLAIAAAGRAAGR